MKPMVRSNRLARIIVRQICSRAQPYLQWPRKESRLVPHLLDLETYWHDAACSSSSPQPSGRKKYVLPMFPYPSGRLHMGHMRVYTISDVLARYYRLNKFDVIHPIGWDAFGLPAENAARERGVEPEAWTYSNIAAMREQLLRTGIIFDWNREIFTCSPEYYRWTQWLFCQLHSRGLVDRALSEVNWDPVDGTVLAEEQIDDNGRSWRSGAIAEKRKLRQWHIKTTKYAKRLLEGLGKLSQWDDVADIQANWIGKCDVWRFLLPIKSKDGTLSEETFDLRIRQPSELANARMVIVNKGHSLSRRLASTADSRLLDVKIVNIVTEKEMPVVFLPEDKTQYSYFLNARLARSDCDLDSAAAAKFGINLTSESLPHNSDDVLRIANAGNYGGYETSRKLIDWVVSRQRKWGTPIPMLLDAKDGITAATVRDDRLPILPSQVEARKEIECDRLPSGLGILDTDTLDTFFDSSWYYLRYLDPKNEDELIGRDKCHQMPVDVYVGGIEHAAVHMFFARFISHFLFDIGVIETPEPFDRLIPQGIVRGRTFVAKDTGKYLSEEDVIINGSNYVDKKDGNKVEMVYEKMSKSKHNGVDPLVLLKSNGIDVTRLQLIGAASPRSPINWGAKDLKGIYKWLDRVSLMVNEYVRQRKTTDAFQKRDSFDNSEETLRSTYNWMIRHTSAMLGVLHNHYGALTRLYEFSSTLKSQDVSLYGSSVQFERCLHSLVIMMQVFAPHAANELWSALCSVSAVNESCRNREAPVSEQLWPVIDADADTEFMLETMRTSCGRVQVPRTVIEGCKANKILQLAKDTYHRTFFEILDEMGFEPSSYKVEEYAGLLVILTLQFDENFEEKDLKAALRKNQKFKKKQRD